MALVKWSDNKCVTLASNFVGAEPTSEVGRYDKKKKERIQVPRLAIVGVYNTNMGGVDLLDMMCTLYKTHLKSKRWYMFLFYHTVTIAMVNAWFVYKRHAKSLGVVKTLPLRQFQSMASDGLLKCRKVPRGRPSLDDVTPPAKKKRKVIPRPIDDSRYDNVAHWPLPAEKRNRCRLCVGGYTQTKCSKCRVHLCLKSTKNCFVAFHHK